MVRAGSRSERRYVDRRPVIRAKATVRAKKVMADIIAIPIPAPAPGGVYGPLNPASLTYEGRTDLNALITGAPGLSPYYGLNNDHTQVLVGHDSPSSGGIKFAAFDITDPTLPILLDELSSDGSYGEGAVSGMAISDADDYAFGASEAGGAGYDGFCVVNAPFGGAMSWENTPSVTNVANPAVHDHGAGTAAYPTLLGGTHAIGHDPTTGGTYRTFNLSNPSAPSAAGVLTGLNGGVGGVRLGALSTRNDDGGLFWYDEASGTGSAIDDSTPGSPSRSDITHPSLGTNMRDPLLWVPDTGLVIPMSDGTYMRTHTLSGTTFSAAGSLVDSAKRGFGAVLSDRDPTILYMSMNSQYPTPAYSAAQAIDISTFASPTVLATADTGVTGNPGKPFLAGNYLCYFNGQHLYAFS